MITTLTLNPSYDRTVLLDELRVGEVQRVLDTTVEAAGKGVNIARALATNGHPTRAVFPGDPPADGVFRAQLEPIGVTCRVVPRTAPTRTNLSVVEGDGTTTKLNEPGEPLDPRELDALLDAVIEAEDGMIAVAGSLPAGTEPDVYAELAKRLAAPERHLAVDTSGAALAALVGSPCAVAKPNDEELAELVGVPLHSLGQVVEAATDLQRRGWSSVLVSLGPHGAVLVEGDRVTHGRARVETARNTVGAGDALLAGYLAGSLPGDGSGPDALAEALAWARAAVSSPGTGFPPVTARDRAAVELVASIEPDLPLTERATEEEP